MNDLTGKLAILTAAVTIALSGMNPAQAASFNFSWNFFEETVTSNPPPSQDKIDFLLSGTVDGDLVNGKVTNLTNLMSTFVLTLATTENGTLTQNLVKLIDFNQVLDSSSFFTLDGRDVFLKFGGTHVRTEDKVSNEIVDETGTGTLDLTFTANSPLRFNEQFQSANIRETVQVSLGQPNGCNFINQEGDSNNSFSLGCKFNAAQKVPDPTSTLSLLTLGTLGAASTLKHKLISSLGTTGLAMPKARFAPASWVREIANPKKSQKP